MDIKFNIGDKVKVIDNPEEYYTYDQKKKIGQVGVVKDFSEIPFIKFKNGKILPFSQYKLELVQEDSVMEIEVRYHVGNKSFATWERAQRAVAMQKLEEKVEEEFGKGFGTYPAFLNILRNNKDLVITYLEGLESND